MQSDSKHVILIADDDDAVRTVSRITLERQGYDVLSAENGAAAVEVFDASSKKVHLVLLDLTMPGLSGMETLELLLQREPELKVLIYSGYPASEEVQGNLSATVRFLQKPLAGQQLSVTISEMLSVNT